MVWIVILHLCDDEGAIRTYVLQCREESTTDLGAGRKLYLNCPFISIRSGHQ